MSEKLGSPVSRKIGKRNRHLWNYGGTPNKIALVAAGDGITLKIAKAGVEILNRMHPDAVEWREALIRRVSKVPILRTAFGRVAFFTLTKRRGTVVPDDPNVAFAFEPQSVASDIAKRAWIRIKEVQSVRMINHSHDSFTFLKRKEDDFSVIREIQEMMIRPVPELQTPDNSAFVPKVDIQVGMNWGEFNESNPEGLKKWEF